MSHGAFDLWQNMGQRALQTCLPCNTIGRGTARNFGCPCDFLHVLGVGKLASSTIGPP